MIADRRNKDAVDRVLLLLDLLVSSVLNNRCYSGYPILRW